MLLCLYDAFNRAARVKMRSKRVKLYLDSYSFETNPLNKDILFNFKINRVKQYQTQHQRPK